MQILFGVECVDDVLQTMLQQHPSGATREVSAGVCCKVRRVVYRSLRRRVGRKTEKRDAWNVKIRSSEQGLLPWKRRKEDKRGQETRGETAWKSRMRPSVAKNWMNRGKTCRRSPRLMQESLKESLQHQMQEVKKGGTIACLSTRRCKREHERYKASRTKETSAERKFGSKRGNAETQTGN